MISMTNLSLSVRVCCKQKHLKCESEGFLIKLKESDSICCLIFLWYIRKRFLRWQLTLKQIDLCLRFERNAIIRYGWLNSVFLGSRTSYQRLMKIVYRKSKCQYSNYRRDTLNGCGTIHVLKQRVIWTCLLGHAHTLPRNMANLKSFCREAPDQKPAEIETLRKRSRSLWRQLRSRARRLGRSWTLCRHRRSAH